MSKESRYNRRQFLNNAFMAIGAAELSMMGFGNIRTGLSMEVLDTIFRRKRQRDLLTQSLRSMVILNKK